MGSNLGGSNFRILFAIGFCFLLTFAASTTVLAQSIRPNIGEEEDRGAPTTANIVNRTVDISRYPSQSLTRSSVAPVLNLQSMQLVPSSQATARGCIFVPEPFDEANNIAVISPSIPEWVSVARSDPAVVAEGVVANAGVSRSDYPLKHNSHDFDFSVKLDPQYNGLNSDANTLVPGSSTERLLGVEWETKNLPQDFWPTAGDRVWIEGRWIFDCGHKPYKTEIHPPQALAVSRFEPIIFQGQTKPSDAVKTSIFIGGKGGYYNVPVGGRNYEFDVALPPKPSSGASVRTQVLSVPFGGISPTLTPVPAVNPTKVHVKYPLASVPASVNNKFGAVIAAGWVESQNTASYRQLTVTIDKIKILDDHDPNIFVVPGLNSGEWRLWVDVNGMYKQISGLNDVNDGDTINVKMSFPPIWVKDVNAIGQPNHIIIKTTGWESDEADRFFGCGGGFDHAGEPHCSLVPLAIDDNDALCNLSGSNTQHSASDNFGIGRSISSPIIRSHVEGRCSSDFVLTYHISEGVTNENWGPWKSVSEGSTKPGAQITAVPIGGGKIQLFLADPNGGVYTNSGSGTSWGSWTNVSEGSTIPGGIITAVPIGSGKIALFVADANGGVYTNSGSGTSWGSWTNVSEGSTKPGAQITAVPIGSGKIALFAVDPNGGVYTNSGSGTSWGSWTNVSEGSSAPGGIITAVPIGGGKIQLFLADANGGVYTNSGSGTSWGSWTNVSEGKTLAGSQVTAVALGGVKVGLVLSDPNGGVYSISGSGTSWGLWKSVSEGSTIPGGKVTAVPIGGGKVELFLADRNGGVYTATGTP